MGDNSLFDLGVKYMKSFEHCLKKLAEFMSEEELRNFVIEKKLHFSSTDVGEFYTGENTAEAQK